MLRAAIRQARTSRRCERCRRWIYPGDHYLESVISPDHSDVGNTSWWRMGECRQCAVDCERWPLANGAVPMR
jgi:hypothetical protein